MFLSRKTRWGEELHLDCLLGPEIPWRFGKMEKLGWEMIRQSPQAPKITQQIFTYQFFSADTRISWNMIIYIIYYTSSSLLFTISPLSQGSPGCGPRPTSSSRTLARGFSSAPFSKSHSARPLLDCPGRVQERSSWQPPSGRSQIHRTCPKAFGKKTGFAGKSSSFHHFVFGRYDSLSWYHHGRTVSEIWWSIVTLPTEPLEPLEPTEPPEKYPAFTTVLVRTSSNPSKRWLQPSAILGGIPILSPRYYFFRFQHIIIGG